MHDQVGLFEILLNLVFRPYNAYCIYVDNNSNKKSIRESIDKLVGCYKHLYPETDIFMAKNTTKITWGNYSLIEADLKCMEQLLQLKEQ